MSDKITKQCLVCKNTFEPCSTCHQFSGWRAVVCCPQHYMYHMPIISYERHLISKEQARKELQLAIDAYGMIDFNNNVIKIVNEILADDTIEDNQEVQAEIKTNKKKSKYSDNEE